MGTNKDLSNLLRRLRKQGWRIEQGRKHIKCYPADRSQPFVVLPSSPSDGRWLKNATAQLRRSGADL